MSDVMLLGILRMPYDMAMGGEISRHQYHSCGKEAAERIQADTAEIARLRAEVERLTAAIYDERAHADVIAKSLHGIMRAYSEPDRRICCNGNMCGCRGSTVREMEDHYAAEALEAHRARRQG